MLGDIVSLSVIWLLSAPLPVLTKPLNIEQSSNPHFLSKRALPSFINFQGEDGTTQKNRLTQAFKDMVEVVNGETGVLKADSGTFDQVYAKYFDPQHKDAVKKVFQNMVQPADQDASTGADILAKIKIDAKDFGELCANNVAYTVNDYEPPIGAAYPAVHFCTTGGHDAYKYPDLSEIDCTKLDDWVSYKMLSLGGYSLVHELSHVNLVSKDPLNDIFLPDNYLKEVTDYQYGSQGTTGLLAIDQGPAKAATNADSYAWFANELYWSAKCDKKFGKPKDNDYFWPGVCPPKDPSNPDSGTDTSKCLIR